MNPDPLAQASLGRAQVALVVILLAFVLSFDVRTDIVGQMGASAAIWALTLLLLSRMAATARHALLACLVIATAGELFLSLVWGLYGYRLGNVPLFVPPGHVLMLLLGLSLAPCMSEQMARGIIGASAAYTLVAAVEGVDTLAVPLFFVLLLASLALPQQRRLYASTFVLSLMLELYGTWLGNWTWARDVPALALVTTNPPGAAGALYCALDALVATTTLYLVPRLGRGAPVFRARPTP